MSPRGPYAKGFKPSMQLYWDGMGPRGRKLDHWGCALEGSIGTDPLLSLQLLPIYRHAQVASLIPHHHHQHTHAIGQHGTPHHRPEARRTTSGTGHKNEPSLSWWSSGFCHSNGNRLSLRNANTPCCTFSSTKVCRVPSPLCSPKSHPSASPPPTGLLLPVCQMVNRGSRQANSHPRLSQ